jgi:hypothetical protein
MSIGSRGFVLCAALLFAPFLSAPEAVADSPAPGIEPRVDTLLRDMSAYLKGASEFSFRTEVNYDQVLESGQKILYGRHAEISMRRPDRLHILVNGDLVNERIWYNGKTFILMDLWNHEYMKVAVPPKIDEALDFMARKYGIASPVSDVLYRDVYAILTEKVVTGVYIGQPVVRGVPTHHLAFTQKSIDWQLWIEDGANPVPRKVVITYKSVAGSPQFTVWLSDWNFAPRLADSLFDFLPPDGAKQVDLRPVDQ